VGSPTAEGGVALPKISAKVEVVEPMGAETYLYVNTGKHAFVARIDPHRRCRVGDDVQLAIMIEKAHLFDLHTNAAIF
jgi:multiple sugar transport system ATP-binding protein